jgi:hypothetical protein
MGSLPSLDPLPIRLDLDARFGPCEVLEGEELYPNGIEIVYLKLQSRIRPLPGH